jgi:flagellar biosynthesis protein FlhG
VDITAGGGVMGEEKKERHIWAVAGGKGGIGKSFVAANLGIALSERGKRVIVVDADLGGANLHTFLGIPQPTRGLDDFMREGMRSIRGVITETGIPNLHLIAGVHDLPTLSTPKQSQKQKIIRHICSLDADHIILDLATGMASYVFDFFLVSENGILLCTPEPTSLENAYQFIRGVYFHRWMNMATDKEVRKLIEKAMDGNNPEGIRTPFDLLARIEQVDQEVGEMFKRTMKGFRPRLIINQARNRKEAELGFAVRSACRKYFGLELSYLGYILYDSTVYLTVQRGQPFFLDYPSSDVTECIRGIASRMSDERGLEWSLS